MNRFDDHFFKIIFCCPIWTHSYKNGQKSTKPRIHECKIACRTNFCCVHKFICFRLTSFHNTQILVYELKWQKIVSLFVIQFKNTLWYLNIFWIANNNIQLRPDPYSNKVTILFNQITNEIKIFCFEKKLQNLLISVSSWAHSVGLKFDHTRRTIIKE